MPKKNICDELEKDAQKYADRIHKELSKFEPKMIPVAKEIGEAYMRAFRKANGIPFVVQLSRQTLAYLYKYVIDNGLEGGAVGFATYDENELGPVTDPNWDPKKSHQNTGVIGIWDVNRGIVPFNTSTGQIYDDWSQEWP
jgi:hypothetical protein